MDTRVLTAVFVTLFAVAIGMQHGAFSTDQFFDSLDGLQDAGDLGDVLDRQRPDRPANTSVDARVASASTVEITANDPVTVTLALRERTDARVGDSRLRTTGNDTVRLDGFTGTVTLSGDNLSVEGTARNVTTSSLTFTYGSPVGVMVDGPRASVAMDAVTGQTLTFANATGTVTAGDTTIRVDDELARFEHFDGNISVTDETYTLRGAVFRAALGDARIGG